jgi:cytochrome c-type biogenesis protein CcmH
MKRFLMLLLLLLPLSVSAAVYSFDNPAEATRFRQLTEELRCLVCQGQSIADSNSDLAEDLKGEVYRMIQAGRTDSEITGFMVARYGDFVLFTPPVRGSTWLLWFGPLVLLLVGALVVVALVRQRAPAVELSAEERERLARALEQAPDRSEER